MKRKNRSFNCTNNNEKTTTEKTKQKYKNLCNRAEKVRKGYDRAVGNSHRLKSKLITTMTVKRF